MFKGLDFPRLGLRLYFGKARSSWGKVTWLGGTATRHVVGLYGLTWKDSFFGRMVLKKYPADVVAKGSK